MPPLTAKICQKSGKRGKIRKNQEEKAQIGKFLHFANPDRKGWLRYCWTIYYKMHILSGFFFFFFFFASLKLPAFVSFSNAKCPLRGIA